MNIDDMLEVLNAYKQGEKIEYSWDDGKSWAITDFPTWNFDTVQYRIAKPEPKKVKLEAWLNTFHGAIEYRKLPHGFHDNAEWIRIPSEDKEITLP